MTKKSRDFRKAVRLYKRMYAATGGRPFFFIPGGRSPVLWAVGKSLS